MEQVFLGSGVALLAFFTVVHAHSSIGRQQALDAFHAAQTESAHPATRAGSFSIAPTPDQSLWSAGRIRAYEASLYEASLADGGALAQGVLRIERLGLEVPVFASTSERDLNRGVGLIEGTAAPGEGGNVGIAGHRDGFFRVLKDIRAGDAIDVETLHGSTRYLVEEIFVVMPEDTYVLDSTPTPSVTLVTCFPFYLVGHAPERLIVRGVLASFEESWTSKASGTAEVAAISRKSD